jgi:hypothetical protein
MPVLGAIVVLAETWGATTYEVEDRISGETGTINPFAVVGVTAAAHGPFLRPSHR